MKKWLLLAVIGLLAACSQSGIEELTTPTGGDAPIFYASFEGADAESRTYLDETGKMRWTHDDRITIFFGENYNREFAFVGATGTTAGSFEQISTDGFYTAEKMAANYAIYPHAAKTILEAEGYFKCTLPAVQNYAEGSFGLNANTMVSVTKSVDDRFLQFKNVGGYLKLNLYGANVTVKQITLQGNNNEPLAGAAIVTPTYGGEPTLTWAASGTTKTLTLDCGAGVKIGQTEEDATAFYLVVPPTTFEKGFTVTITDAKGKVCTKSTSNEQTFTRNVTKNMPAFEAKCKAPNPVPSNQIWYTSTNGKIVEPDNTGAFGVAIKSNTYTDGKGVITFEGDVTTIGEDAFYGCTSLASITLPEGVTTIGDEAFWYCTSLASITLPEGVTTIGEYAFDDCRSLASITLPESVTTIVDGAFWGCTSLASITIPEGVTTIGQSAFYHCTSLASITIPEGVTTIVSYAFAGCTSLASITLPEGVTTIGNEAFLDCTSLASITIPEGVTTIGGWAFLDCTSLKSVSCKPTTPPSGGSDMFDNNASGRKIYVPAGSANAYKAAKYWSDYAADIVDPTVPVPSNQIWYTSIDGNIVEPYNTGVFGVAVKSNTYTDGKGVITFEGDVTTIGEEAFRYCESLASITLPEGVTTIGRYAFSLCRSLASITIPDGVTTIGSYAFSGCTGLASITLPEGVTEIGYYAFYGCTSLQQVYITDITAWCQISFSSSDSNPMYYGADLYLNNVKVEHLVIPEGVTTIGRYAFQSCTSLARITIPEGVTSIEYGAFYGCTSLASITLPEGVTTIGSYAFYDCRSLASITIPEGLTEIGNYAFSGCTSLANITLPEGVTTIGEGAFSGCTSLASITLPEGVTTIGQSAFYGCTSLASITIPEGITTIRDDAFYGCTSLASITLPESLTTIGKYAFSECTSLTSITLPEGVTTIGERAFYGCTSLKSVYCKPTTPPSGGFGMFYSHPYGRKIYVPASDDDSIIKAYKAASGWSNYASSIVEYQF